MSKPLELIEWNRVYGSRQMHIAHAYAIVNNIGHKTLQFAQTHHMN